MHAKIPIVLVLKINHTTLAQSRPQAFPDTQAEDQEDCASIKKIVVKTTAAWRGVEDLILEAPTMMMRVPST